ncbi:hypothetical protein VUR80DRAFT_8197 [Thermomyces stellatus]
MEFRALSTLLVGAAVASTAVAEHRLLEPADCDCFCVCDADLYEWNNCYNSNISCGTIESSHPL